MPLLKIRHCKLDESINLALTITTRKNIEALCLADIRHRPVLSSRISDSSIVPSATKVAAVSTLSMSCGIQIMNDLLLIVLCVICLRDEVLQQLPFFCLFNCKERPVKMPPQVLQRVSVRWLPEPSFEDTETIALNVGGYYLDLRVTKADGLVQWSRAGERKVLSEKPCEEHFANSSLILPTDN